MNDGRQFEAFPKRIEDVRKGKVSRFNGVKAVIPDRIISLKELALHNADSNCWIAVRGNVYDISCYWKEHPGGRVILKAAGKDGTDLFNKSHFYINPLGFCRRVVGKLGEEKPRCCVM